jgi:hypothetical protein
MMREGVPTWTAAGFLGMSERVLIENYGHHHPDLQGSAAQALAGGRRNKALTGTAPGQVRRNKA